MMTLEEISKELDSRIEEFRELKGKLPKHLFVTKEFFDSYWTALLTAPEIWIDADPDLGIEAGWYKPQLYFDHHYAELGYNNLLYHNIPLIESEDGNGD